jgi:cell division protein FtsB
MNKLKPVFSILKNKYFIASLLFVVWMLFFDPKDWSLIHERKNKLTDLEQSEEVLEQRIKDTRVELDLLKTNAQTIEQYAREKYYMKKDNEDLFIVNSAE